MKASQNVLFNSSVTKSLKNVMSFHKWRVPKARKRLRNTMTPWTLQWGPHSFMGKGLFWVTSALQTWVCSPNMSFRNVRLCFSISFISRCCHHDFRWVGKRNVTKKKKGKALNIGVLEMDMRKPSGRKRFNKVMRDKAEKEGKLCLGGKGWGESGA